MPAVRESDAVWLITLEGTPTNFPPRAARRVTSGAGRGRNQRDRLARARASTRSAAEEERPGPD